MARGKRGVVAGGHTWQQMDAFKGAGRVDDLPLFSGAAVTVQEQAAKPETIRAEQLTLDRAEYDAAEDYSRANRRAVMALYVAGQYHDAYKQYLTDALAVRMTFAEFAKHMMREWSRAEHEEAERLARLAVPEID